VKKEDEIHLPFLNKVGIPMYSASEICEKENKSMRNLESESPECKESLQKSILEIKNDLDSFDDLPDLDVS